MIESAVQIGAGEAHGREAAAARGFRPYRQDVIAQLSLLRRRTRLRRYLRLCALLGNVLAVVLAFLACGLLRFGDPLDPHVRSILYSVVPVFVVVTAHLDGYDREALTRIGPGYRKALNGLAVAVGAIGLSVFFLQVGEAFSRAVFAAGGLLSVVLIAAARYVLVRTSSRLFGDTLYNEVLIEDGHQFASGSNSLVLDTREHGLLLRLNDPMALDQLGRYLRYADRVIVACAPERRVIWSTALKGADVEGEVVAPELDDVGSLGTARYRGASTIVVAKSPLDGLDGVLKRCLDLSLVTLALPALLPLFAIIAAAIKLDSPGPVFFRQKRVGLGNCQFDILKFRSMYVESSDKLGDRSTERNDSRITRVGRFIRATSLDELPQLVNVLRGDMSIVGPRPHPLMCKADDQLFWDIDLAYWHRHAVKPGMTGLAQVRGFRGATETSADLTNRLQADLEYLSGWTIWRDLIIILTTFRVLIHRNAY